MRLNRDTGPPAKMHDEMLRVFAVFLEGLEMIVTGAESNVAQTRPSGGASLPSAGADGGSAISRDN